MTSVLMFTSIVNDDTAFDNHSLPIPGPGHRSGFHCKSCPLVRNCECGGAVTSDSVIRRRKNRRTTMPGFRNTFIRLRRRARQRQDTVPTPRPSPEAAAPAQPIETQDGGQTQDEGSERTQDEVLRHLQERLDGRNNHIRNIEAEAARLWAETVILEAEIQASRRRARSRSAAASPWGNSVGSIVLHQILVDEQVERRRNRNRNANARLNHLHAGDELENETGGGSPTRGQSPGEGTSGHRHDFRSSQSLAHIGEHIMRVFNDLSAEERPSMAAWIVLMAAVQVRRDLESAAEYDELVGRHVD